MNPTSASEADLELLRRSFDVARRSREAGDHPFGSVLAGPDGEVLREQGNGYRSRGRRPHRPCRAAARLLGGQDLRPRLSRSAARSTPRPSPARCARARSTGRASAASSTARARRASRRRPAPMTKTRPSTCPAGGVRGRPAPDRRGRAAAGGGSGAVAGRFLGGKRGLGQAGRCSGCAISTATKPNSAACDRRPACLGHSPCQRPRGPRLSPTGDERVARGADIGDRGAQSLNDATPNAGRELSREDILARLAERERDLAEARERQRATSEILRVISQSPIDARLAFDAIAASANRLLGGFSTTVWRFEGGQAHLAALTPPMRRRMRP